MEEGLLLTFHGYLKLCHFLPISAKAIYGNAFLLAPPPLSQFFSSFHASLTSPIMSC